MRKDGTMGDIETKLAALEATDHEGAWAIVREAELVVPAVVGNPRDPASGKFLQIQHGDLTVILAFTSKKKIGGFVTQTKHHIKVPGSDLAANIPEGSAIGLNLGQPDARLFLPDVIAADAQA